MDNSPIRPLKNTVRMSITVTQGINTHTYGQLAPQIEPASQELTNP